MSENPPTRSLDDIDLAALRVSIITIIIAIIARFSHLVLLQSQTNGPCRCYVIFEFSSDTITVMLHPRNKLKSNQHPPTLPGAVCAVGSWDVYNHKSQQNVSSDLSKSYTLLFHAGFLIL